MTSTVRWVNSDIGCETHDTHTWLSAVNTRHTCSTTHKNNQWNVTAQLGEHLVDHLSHSINVYYK